MPVQFCGYANSYIMKVAKVAKRTVGCGSSRQRRLSFRLAALLNSPRGDNRHKVAASVEANLMELNQTIYTHEKYTEGDQYWSAESEEYAAASQLISIMRDGWMLALPRVSARQIWNSGSRPRTVYDFTLMRGSQLMIMPVLSNPYIERYIIQNDLRIIYDIAQDCAVIPD